MKSFEMSPVRLFLDCLQTPGPLATKGREGLIPHETLADVQA